LPSKRQGRPSRQAETTTPRLALGFSINPMGLMKD
jgi:hypothetical protein